MIVIKAFIFLFVIGLLVVISFSASECLEKTALWQGEVAKKLVSLFEVDPSMALSLVKMRFPLKTMVLKDHPHPDMAANMIFWSTEVQNNIKAIHFKNSEVPMHLYSLDNYGRITLEA